MVICTSLPNELSGVLPMRAPPGGMTCCPRPTQTNREVW